MLSYTKNALAICLISDGWSNVRGDSVINFVLTTPRPIFHKSIIATGVSHTGDFIGEQLCNVIEQVGSEKICAIITDNAHNMKSAWKYVEQRYPHIFSIGCVAHSLHLLCKDLISKIASIHDVCTKATKVVDYFKSHHHPKFEMEEQQRRQYGKTIALKKFTPKRRGSVHAMFSSLVKSKDPIVSVAGFVLQSDVRHIILSDAIDDVDSLGLTGSFWEKVKYLEYFFQPIVNLILKFEKDLPQLSHVYSELFKLQDYIVKSQSDNLIIYEETKLLFDKR